MDYELLNVAWVTAAVVATTGVTMMALALTCKALQRCYLRCRRQRLQLHRRQQQTAILTNAAASASVAATTASAAATLDNDSFDTFLQLSLNSQQPGPMAATSNGPPQQLASRSPRGRSIAVLRSPIDPGNCCSKPRTAASPKPQQHVLDSGRPMTFEIRTAEDSEDDIEADTDSCEDARHQKPPISHRLAEAVRTSGRAVAGQPAAARASGVSAGFYDPGGYDMEWPPTSSGRLAAPGGGGDGWHPARQQQQQQHQGRRGHIFFGRGASHGTGGRNAGNL